jgi:plastocyanin
MYYLQSVTSTFAVTGSLWGIPTGGGVPWNASSTYHSLMPSGIAEPAEQVVEITVGAAGQLAFNPDSVSVMKGTLLRFNFLGINHTLTQSSLAHPCLNGTEFDTGFQQFNPKNVSGKYLVDFKVESDEPSWFYCAQTAPKSHCRSGMVFSLNPGAKYVEFVENAVSAETPPQVQVTSTPSQNFCAGPSYTTPSYATNVTSYHPSGGTLSWSFPRPNATAIVPEISNRGWRQGHEILKVVGAMLVALEF